MKAERTLRTRGILPGVAVALIALGVLSPGDALARSTVPPASLTGAPGEGTCYGCHGPLNNPGGSVSILGVPASYTPGQTYPLKIMVQQPSALSWGFELTALRNADNSLAGTLAAVNDSTITQSGSGGFASRLYLSQTTTRGVDGTAAGTAGWHGWTFNWTAPAAGAGLLTFYGVGLACNNNGQKDQGDLTYSTTVQSAEAVSANHAPTLAQPSNMTVNEGATADQALAGSDPDGDALTFTKVGGPLYMTVTTTSPTAGNVHLAPGFSDAGAAAATVRATDGSLSDTKSFTVTVNDVNRAPVANAGGPYFGVAGVAVSFSGAASSDPDGDPLVFAWTFGDGGTASGPAPSHAYATAAGSPYPVTLTVTDNGTPNLSDAAATTATISDACPATVLNDYDTIRLGAGRPFWCAHFQPAGGCYANTDVILPSIVLKYAGKQIPAFADKTLVDGDKNGDGIMEIKVCFTKPDLRTLFGGTGLAVGHNIVTATLEGNLASGGKFQGATQVDVVNNGSFTIAAVAPNPLNPNATLTFTTAERGFVKIEMYDLQGRLVRTLLDEPGLEAGSHDVTIDGRGRSGEKLASGIYFIRGTAPRGEFRTTVTILR